MTTNSENDNLVKFPGAPVAPAPSAGPAAAAATVAVTRKAAIAYIHRPEVTAGFNVSLVQLVAADLLLPAPVFEARILDHGAPPYLNLARNAVVKQFLDEFPAEIEILFFLDSDQRWESENAYQIVNLIDPIERPVVCALYFAWDAQKYMPRPLVLVNGKRVSQI